MPRFRVRVDFDFVGLVMAMLEPVDDEDTNVVGPLGAGQMVSVRDGSRADAASAQVTLTCDAGAPALQLEGLEDGVVFQIDPAPPSGPAVIGPMNVGDDPAAVAQGKDGSTGYTVTAMTTAQAKTLGLIP